MMKSKKLTLGISLIVISILAYFVMAAPGDSIVIRSPLSGTNYSSISGIIFNASYTNASDITNPANATFFLNISGAWMRIGNTSVSGGCTINSCSANLTNLTIPDGVYSVNATIYNGTPGATISIIHMTNLSNTIYIDGTRPLVSESNISGPLTGGNYSQNLIINVSVIDALIGVQTVFFNITNATSGLQNSTPVLSREGSTSSYSLTINTSHYISGYYNLTVFANDSLGNLNSSARVYQIIFDNIPPAVSFTCEDYTVDEDDIMDCDCDSSDTLSGIASENFDPTPSTVNTGNNQQSTCTVTDRAGNINTSIIYYNVTGGSSSGSSSSSSSSSSSTTQGSTNSSSSTNSTSNSTTQNSSSGEANQLQANQQNQNESSLKINYWILSLIVVGAVTIFVMIKKGILQRLLKFNK